MNPALTPEAPSGGPAMSGAIAHKVQEIRIPVPAGPVRALTHDEFASDSPSAEFPRIEYVVVERWSDFTMRHPTTGNVVAMDFWQQDQRRALNFLRTGEKEIHYIRTGEWK